MRRFKDQIMNNPQPGKTAGSDFANQAKRKQQGLIWELWGFLRHNKKWWLTPILFVLLLFGALLIFVQGSAVAQFIYPLF